MSYLFVYGTLMKKENNPYNQLIKSNSSLIGKGYIHAKKHDLGLYPGVKLDSKKEHQTYGELYEIKTNTEHVFNELDFYEVYIPSDIEKSLFVRKEASVFINGKTELKAWTYEYAKTI